MASGPPKFQEGAPSLELARETDKDRRGGPANVSNVLSSSVAGGINIWGEDLGFVDGDVQESGRATRGLSQTGDGAEGQASYGRYLEKRGVGGGNQGISNPYTVVVH